jgi:hypothetical protein
VPWLPSAVIDLRLPRKLHRALTFSQGSQTMTDAPLWVIVDASVGIKLFVEEDYSDKMHSLFKQSASDIPAILYVPDLFYNE